MSGGGTKSKSQSFSGSGQKWAQPFAINASASVQDVFNQNQPGLAKLTGMAQDSLAPALMDRFNASGPGVGAARDYNMGVVRGDYMGGNPHLQAMIDKSRGDIMGDVGGMFARSGRYGSGAHQDSLVDSLADMETQYRFANYGQEMARRDGAAGQLAQAGAADAAQAMAGLGVGAELPYTGMNSLANSLGSLFAGGTEKSKSKGPGGLMSALGGIGAGLASNPKIFSDRRMKTKIEEIGLWDGKDGLKKYRFAYKGAPDMLVEGVMADEVKELRPDAYIPNYKGSGYDAVNYAAL